MTSLLRQTIFVAALAMSLGNGRGLHAQEPRAPELQPQAPTPGVVVPPVHVPPPSDEGVIERRAPPCETTDAGPGIVQPNRRDALRNPTTDEHTVCK